MTRRLLLAVVLSLAVTAPAAASGPPLTVSKAKPPAAYKCPIPVSMYPTATPVMFVTGTGASGDQGYLIGQDAFDQPPADHRLTPPGEPTHVLAHASDSPAVVSRRQRTAGNVTGGTA